MAQYDVYVNPNPASREAVPYIVDVQSQVLDQLNTRLTMPLRRFDASNVGLPLQLIPRLPVGDATYVLYAHQAAVMQHRLLKKPVASLGSHAAEILRALDAVTSGI